ncbi:hypothetical protein GGD92_16145 [Pseudomonas protegens]|uniref:Uncharacterized protein n=1 Tax=Pseudomonas protegens TaxID=380021 RepID=A0A7G8YE32_9PSED|nr:hypothetical protein [Pseudomonas protegens]QNH79699.1 hypothetical protein GGI48_11220 [Pseudomonas protegens]QNL03126.1 hypothetical protein GGD92_16145 [Pseudomonas protegens]
MPRPRFVIDSLAIANATPKRRHVDLRASLTAALNEFVELGIFQCEERVEGLSIWKFTDGTIVAQEDFYEDAVNRRFIFTQLTKDAALGVILRARHAGDRAAIAKAIIRY